MAESIEDEDLEDIDMGSSESGNSENQDLSGSSDSFSVLKDIIGSKPPPKPLESYQDHPLNFDGTDSSGRIIKGMEGILTDLNKAVLLVIMGLVEKYQDKKRPQNPETLGIENNESDTEH